MDYIIPMQTQHAVDNQIAIALGILQFCCSKDSPLGAANRAMIKELVSKLESAQSAHRNKRKFSNADR